MLRISIAAILFTVATLATGDSLSAKQYVQQVNGKEVIVHTNPLPVVVHRVFPPYLGKHVTQARVNGDNRIARRSR